MISLKTNSKGAYVPAVGRRTRASTIYTPNQADVFSVSRSKVADFRKCRRCFYLDRVRGLQRPSTPGWSLNATTDLLLKKEFDKCREKQIPHRIMEVHGLTHVVPFKHEEMDKWRDSLRHGLSVRFKSTNIILKGGVDDIWWDTKARKLVVVDYKSQASSTRVTVENYLLPTYRKSYAEQMDFYAYLLQEMGFEVSETAYFYVCNANRDAEAFGGNLNFHESLVPYAWNDTWVEPTIGEMIQVMNSTEVPGGNPSCENCAYGRQQLELLDRHGTS